MTVRSVTKFTPGPWEVSPMPSGWKVTAPDSAINPTTALVYGLGSEANARLIAAAPDLLDAARYAWVAIQDIFASYYEEELSTPMAQQALNAGDTLKRAIAKAEGRE